MLDNHYSDQPHLDEERIRREERERCAAVVEYVMRRVEQTVAPGPVRQATVDTMRHVAGAIRAMHEPAVVEVAEPDMTNVVRLR
jgi:hypothetical protein